MAHTYEIDLNILNLYLSNESRTLGMGGIDLNNERESVDLYHPARLVYDDKTYISYVFAGENVLNDSDSKGEDPRIKSKESQLTSIINFGRAGIIKKSSIGFRYSVDSASGNVGIGTTGPSEKLEVAGKVKATAFVGDGSGLTGIGTVKRPELTMDIEGESVDDPATLH